MASLSRRGLSGMRTHTTRKLNAISQPHEIYMKLTSLEIERSRRAAEREAMRLRVESLTERLSEIEAEQAEAMKMLHDQGLKLVEPERPSTRVTGKQRARRLTY